MELLKPKDLELVDIDGVKHRYRLGRIPYMDDGREICSQFVVTAAPKLGNYAENKRLSHILFKYVAVITDENTELLLSTPALINNHVPDFQTGMKIEGEMIQHNLGFSLAGILQKYQQEWKQAAPQFIAEILTALRDSSLLKGSALTTNSEQSTT